MCFRPCSGVRRLAHKVRTTVSYLGVAKESGIAEQTLLDTPARLRLFIEPN